MPTFQIAGNILRIQRYGSEIEPELKASVSNTKARVAVIRGFPDLNLNMSDRIGSYVPIIHTQSTVKLDPERPISILRAGALVLGQVDYNASDLFQGLHFKVDPYQSIVPWDHPFTIANISFSLRPSNSSVLLTHKKVTRNTWVGKGDAEFPLNATESQMLSPFTIPFLAMASLVITSPWLYHYLRLKAIASSRTVEVRGLVINRVV